MSLEVQIATLNSNIVALINALQSIGNGNGHAAPAAAPAPERPSKIAERMADEAPPERTVSLETVQKELVTLEDVKKAVLKLAAKDRKAAVDLLAKHGVKKVGDLPENVWTAVCFAAEDVLDSKEHLNG